MNLFSAPDTVSRDKMMTTNVKTLSVNCPSCKKEVLMTDAFPNRPFCSERCKSVDFGDWATESHKIEGASAEEELWSKDLDSEF